MLESIALWVCALSLLAAVVLSVLYFVGVI